jgi:hypothetical protein
MTALHLLFVARRKDFEAAQRVAENLEGEVTRLQLALSTLNNSPAFSPRQPSLRRPADKLRVLADLE